MIVKLSVKSWGSYVYTLNYVCRRNAGIFNLASVSFCGKPRSHYFQKRLNHHGHDQTGRQTQVDPPCEKHYDIVIAGGGMVGFTMACALGQSKRLSDRHILLLESTPQKDYVQPEDYSNRVCTLNESSQQLLTKLGMWEKLSRPCPVKKMQVWETCSEAVITFDQGDADRAVAHVVENDTLVDAAKKTLSDHVEVAFSSKVNAYELPTSLSNKVKVNLDGGVTISADLLIGADGARSVVREAMKIRYLKWDYDQMGIVATLNLSEPGDNVVAWQRFLPTGPVALLPLSSDCSSLVWSTTKEKAKKLLSLPEEDFTDALNKAFWEEGNSTELVQQVHETWLAILNAVLPGEITQGVRQLPPSIAGIVKGSRAAFPLGLGHAVHYVSPRVVLVGDAAHRIHPLAGQGVNLGFGDVECLQNVLEQAVLLGCDVGDVEQLYKYESERQKYNVAMMASVDGLYRLYSTNFAPVVLLRSLGLSTVDSFGVLKRGIISYAEGS